MTEGQVYPREIERSAHPGAPRKFCFLRLLKASDNERLGLVSRDVGLVYGQANQGLWRAQHRETSRSRRGQSRAGRLGEIRCLEVATDAASSSGEP